MIESPSAKEMKLGIVLRATEGGLQGSRSTFRDMQEMAQTAERVGLDSIWLPDHLLYRSSSRGEVFTMLSALAVVTTRLTLGTIVVSTSFRPPALVAKIAEIVFCARADRRGMVLRS
jgi:alkanesulfonate monooxygenase SsuD/methylene tetrahydromethanopterin reductase-like flavin-dependent oxidoreductase (luciferase family)